MDNNDFEPPITGENGLAPSIDADLASTFTFASHQNSIPVLRSIRVENPTIEPIQDVQLELTASPAFLRQRRGGLTGSTPKITSHYQIVASIWTLPILPV